MAHGFDLERTPVRLQAVEQRAREARKVADEAACEAWNSLAPRPFMLSPVICSSCLPRSPSGQQDDGGHSHAENDGGDPGNFDVGNPSS
jgi:hypothetical protein